MERVLARVAWMVRKGWTSWSKWLARGDSALPVLEEEAQPLGAVEAGIVLCAVAAGLGAVLGGVIGAVVGALTYKPDSDCLVFCSRVSNATLAALIGALPGAVGGLALGLFWLLWRWLRERSGRTPDAT
jgi:hypothetical protein